MKTESTKNRSDGFFWRAWGAVERPLAIGSRRPATAMKPARAGCGPGWAHFPWGKASSRSVWEHCWAVFCSSVGVVSSAPARYVQGETALFQRTAGLWKFCGPSRGLPGSPFGDSMCAVVCGLVSVLVPDSGTRLVSPAHE